MRRTSTWIALVAGAGLVLTACSGKHGSDDDRGGTTGGGLPPSTGPVFYFAPNGLNTNPGTVDSPKRDLQGLNINAAAAGTSYRLTCGGQYAMDGALRLKNLNASAASPITIEGYGSCSATSLAELTFLDGTIAGFEFGESFEDWQPHRGYVLRNLKLIKPTGGPESWGLWLKGEVGDVLIENLAFSGWTTNINAQGGHLTNSVTVQGTDLRGQNGGHGVLGSFTNSVFRNNTAQPGTTGFTHAFYLSEGGGNTLDGNRIVLPGPCTGGGITMHSGSTTMRGQSAPRPVDGAVVTNNVFEYGAGSTDACYGISLSPYENAPAPGGFNAPLVRNNRITNAGGTAINVRAAPGAIIEDNVSILTFDRAQQAVSHGNYDEDPADLAGPGTVRNNTACRRAGGVSGFSASPGSTVTGNVNRTGTDATTGVCALP